jgi:hypothetical protein
VSAAAGAGAVLVEAAGIAVDDPLLIFAVLLKPTFPDFSIYLRIGTIAYCGWLAF